jgi:hypothetical protein
MHEALALARLKEQSPLSQVEQRVLPRLLHQPLHFCARERPVLGERVRNGGHTGLDEWVGQKALAVEPALVKDSVAAARGQELSGTLAFAHVLGLGLVGTAIGCVLECAGQSDCDVTPHPGLSGGVVARAQVTRGWWALGETGESSPGFAVGLHGSGRLSQQHANAGVGSLMPTGPGHIVHGALHW